MEHESTPTVTGVCAKNSPDGPSKLDSRVERGLRLDLDVDGFTRAALEEESAQLGVSIEELVSFAVLYYLADRDSGRIARRLPKPRTPGDPHPLGRLLGD